MNLDSKDPKPKKKFIGFIFAWRGIVEVYKTERNFRFHVAAAIGVVAAGFLFDVTRLEWAVLLTIIPLVMALEMINSSIERVMDYLSPERDPLVGMIKDISAGAVLVASIFAVLIAILIFLPKMISFSWPW
ncbi:diacylglycerol kinase family protein [Halobacillus salinarum]|uniref:Diacylglycerol kinase family protein n=1 Tax=Halobacillus salinarum TaxID=2932257 RepID=A0ABY4EQJ7_9BACI|nr:diacylglycerol kinase family protein [Halobacillus salinarum]UOQ46351.1 diacylglycerol kinase family protein [Halobacillus salinarum]